MLARALADPRFDPHAAEQSAGAAAARRRDGRRRPPRSRARCTRSTTTSASTRRARGRRAAAPPTPAPRRSGRRGRRTSRSGLAACRGDLSGVPWVTSSEIYPTDVRSTAVGQNTLANWLFNFVVAQTFLDLVDLLHAWGAFLFYAAFSIVGGVWMYFTTTCPRRNTSPSRPSRASSRTRTPRRCAPSRRQPRPRPRPG